MNTPEGFDDLVRRKLEERAFPFEEAHWLEAQRAIRATQRRKRPNGWWFAGPVALLIGLGAWWTLDAPDRIVAELPKTSAPIVAEVAERSEGTTSTVITAPTNGSTRELVTSEPSAKAPVGPAPAEVVDKPHAMRTAEPIARPRRNDPSMPERGSLAGAITSREHEQPVTEPGTTVIDVAAKSDVPEPVGSGDPVPTTTKEDPNVAAESAAASIALVAEPAAGGSQITVAPTVIAAEEPVAPVVAETPIHEANADSLIAQPSALTVPDSTVVAADTTLTAEPIPPAPPLVDPASPWEISAMAGFLSTTSRYSGGGSDAWRDAMTSGITPTAGAELMHMGKHFGIGGGVHYSTYAERIRTEDRTSTLVSIQNYWYLQPIDTTFLLITGTFDSLGVTYFEGVPQNITVNVLENGSDTTVTTTLIRSGRDQVNLTSYLEIPLLADAHITQGRWMFGLRGGPMLCVLTGRRGAVPNAADDGYEEFADQAFRSLTVGYTARAYIRYRFNSAWSIGLEPMVKGQLLDTYSSGDLSRRSTGFGGLMSLTYRLR
ncbi:MAG: hypothetical protein KA175_01240 [Flavobacteriales bacterium]|nr:hypothetical protein [Flavobacteriales bacterium]MBP6696209.1 hypothetical protein [Flavobacteriales bacterium]